MKRDPMNKRTKVLLVVVVLALLAVLGTVIAFYVLRQPPVSNEQVEQITSLVGRHYLLPTDETPAVATVEDKTKVSSEFLRAAENGDKLLIYKDAKKVILYRPSIDRIIEVGPVSIAEAGQ